MIVRGYVLSDAILAGWSLISASGIQHSLSMEMTLVHLRTNTWNFMQRNTLALSPLHSEHRWFRLDPSCIECDPDLSSEGSELIDQGFSWSAFLGREECE